METKEYLKLMAEWMDQNRLAKTGQFDASDEELAYWAKHAREANGPALELASGSGRVVVPLLERGIDISGVDNSEAMIERCRAMSEERGVTPTLYNQAVQTLDIGRTFGLVFANAGFLSMFVRDEEAEATLQSVRRHLEPGGKFICTFEQATEKTLKWCAASRSWTGNYFRAPNGALYADRTICKDCSSTPNCWERLLVIEKYADGRLVETEANHRFGRFFLVEEVLRFFESAGYDSLRVVNELTDEPPSKDVTTLAVVARKPVAEE